MTAFVGSELKDKLASGGSQSPDLPIDGTVKLTISYNVSCKSYKGIWSIISSRRTSTAIKMRKKIKYVRIVIEIEEAGLFNKLALNYKQEMSRGHQAQIWLSLYKI